MEKPSYKPLYIQVKDFLLKRIVDEVYKRGEPIPSEAELAKEFETSVFTVRQAVSLLVAEGILIKKQGKRTCVSEQKTTLTFLSWIPETKHGEKILSEVIGLFEKKYPSLDIECIPTTYPNAKIYLTQLIANGEAPDVVQIASIWTSYFASMGALEPLESLLSDANLENRIYDKDLAGCMYHGKLYSVGWGLCSFALIFNKHLVREAGIDHIESPMRLEALMALCQHVQDFYATRRNIYSYGLALSGRESDFMRIFTLLRTFNGRFTDEQGAIVFDSPENVAGFRWLKDFVQRFNVFRSDTYTIRKRFAQGDILFISDAPWVKYQLEELTGEDFENNFDVVLNPVQANPYSASWTNNHALAICGQSRNKLYAAKFIDALTHDPEISNCYYPQVGHLPSNQHYFDDPRYTSPFYTAYKTQLRNAVCMNGQHEMFDSAVVFCLDAADKILFQDVDIEQELSEKAYYLKMLYNKVPGFLTA